MKYLLLTSLLFLAACGGRVNSESNNNSSNTANDAQPADATPSPTIEPVLVMEGIKGMDWILGTWMQQEGPEVFSYEYWSRVSPNKLAGGSCTISKGDTVFKESLEIIEEDNAVVYYANVPHNPGPVGFTLIEQKKELVTFENPKHDFPWKISYHRGADTLYARIAGFRNGQAAFNDFTMTKVK